jgi:ribosome-associated heat shock protein Hsp15
MSKPGAARIDKVANGLRLDKWLWFARFFKSRSLATDAVNGGRVHVNNVRAKPAREVQVGDTLSISRDEVFAMSRVN